MHDRISIRTTGGIVHLPGLSEDWSTDLDQLDQASSAEIVKAIEKADFFGRPAPVASPGVRDGRRHHVSIRLRGRERTLDLPEPLEDQRLSNLVRLLQEARTGRADK